MGKDECDTWLKTLEKDIAEGKDKETLEFDLKNLKGCLSD